MNDQECSMNNLEYAALRDWLYFDLVFNWSNYNYYITVHPSSENNYFILLGDWGCDQDSDPTGVQLQAGPYNIYWLKMVVKVSGPTWDKFIYIL